MDEEKENTIVQKKIETNRWRIKIFLKTNAAYERRIGRGNGEGENDAKKYFSKEIE